MDIKIGSSVVHNTLTFLSVGVVVAVHRDNEKTVFEVAWPNHVGNGFHPSRDISISTDTASSDLDKIRSCWY